VTTLDSLAVTRLRRWAHDRAAIRNGKVTRLSRDGWIERRSRAADARQVGVIDFERAFASLNPDDRLAVLLIYRDELPAAHAGDILHVSPQLATFRAARALSRLAEALDRLDLL